jgi:hypothetical protein
MRWLVEVTSLGGADKESLQLDAESWQGALQLARTKRGESDAIGGFSIDVSADGCRAVDPVSRVAYDVRKAADGTLRPPAAAPRPQPTTTAAAPRIVFKREQDRTQALPLTYREYVFVSPGAAEASAEALLRNQLERIQTSLANLPAGKLVNLAVYDRPFEDARSLAPVATLEWKDWRGMPALAFPRRVAASNAPAAAATTSAPPKPTPVVAAQSDPFAAARDSSSGSVPPPPPSSQPRRPSSRLRQAGARMRGEDLIADLFEAMHELHFLRDAVEAGNFCLAQIMDRLPCKAGLVHSYDIDRREFVVTSCRGTGASALLLKRNPESDAMLAKAMRGRTAFVGDPADAGASRVERYEALGGATSVIVAPAMQSGRFLGAIELLNPLDGQPFTDVEGNAVMYMAEQLAEFVATRGVVTDPERVGARSSA